MALLSQDNQQNHPKEDEVIFKKPYEFLGKPYDSLNQLSIDMMKPNNYEAAISEWETGKIVDAINAQVSISSIKQRANDIYKLKLPEGGDKEKHAKVQLGLVHVLLNPKEGFVIDGVSIAVNNLKKFISFFIYFETNKEDKEKKYLVISESVDLLKEIVGETELVKKLKFLGDLIHRYSKALSEYQLLAGQHIEDLENEILNIDEDILKRRQWVVTTYTDLMQLADSKGVILDKDKVKQNISQFESTTSLTGINKKLKKFKKRYSGATEKWDFIYNQPELSEMESLLLMSAPDEALVVNQSYRILMLVRMWFLVLLAMSGLMAVPYYILKRTDKGQREVSYMQHIGSDQEDIAVDGVSTQDGGIVIGGVTSSFGLGENDFWILKINKDGKVEWSKTVGGDNNDIANVLIESSDQGFFLGGMTANLGPPPANSLLVKLDSTGNRIWNHAYDMGGADEVWGLKELSNKNIVMTGKFTDSAGKSKLFVIYVDSAGKFLWEKKFDDAPSGYGVAVVEGSNQIIVMGNFEKSETQRNLAVLRLNYDGQLLGEKWYRNFDIRYQKLVLTLSDGFLLAGQSQDPVGGKSYIDVIKVDFAGNLIWDRRIASLPMIQPISFSLIKTENSGDHYFLVGEEAELGETPHNTFYNFNSTGDYVPLEWGDPPPQNLVWGTVVDGEITLIGSKDYGKDRQQDVWMLVGQLDIPSP